MANSTSSNQRKCDFWLEIQVYDTSKEVFVNVTGGQMFKSRTYQSAVIKKLKKLNEDELEFEIGGSKFRFHLKRNDGKPGKADI